MKDYIPERPTIQQKSLSFDTIVYQSANSRVRLFELNVLREIALILNFRPSSLKLAEEIIRRQSSTGKHFSITDAEFAEKIWPDLPEAVRNRKFVRSKKNLKEDQQLSNWRFVFIPPRQVIEKNGRFTGVPTKYQSGHYWEVTDTLKFQSHKIDFFALSVREAQKEVCELLKMILADFGAQVIIRAREKSEEKKKEKSPSLPCPKPCAHCSLNEAAKSATVSEANGREELRKIPNESFEAELGKFADFFERYLRERGKIDKAYTYAIKRAHHALEIAEQSAADLIIRERTGHQLRIAIENKSAP